MLDAACVLWNYTALFAAVIPDLARVRLRVTGLDIHVVLTEDHFLVVGGNGVDRRFHWRHRWVEGWVHVDRVDGLAVSPHGAPFVLFVALTDAALTVTAVVAIPVGLVAVHTGERYTNVRTLIKCHSHKNKQNMSSIKKIITVS